MYKLFFFNLLTFNCFVLKSHTHVYTKNHNTKKNYFYYHYIKYQYLINGFKIVVSNHT